jgi:heme A synthase
MSTLQPLESTLPPKGRLFITLAISTALLTLGLIVFGAVVRVTDSGLGCGDHWPSCNGTFFPPLDNVTAWIEWLHRLFAVLIGAFGLITLGVAVYAYRQRNRKVLFATAIAAVLFLVQSGLGAIVVVLELPPTFVTLHLGTAMLLLGALIVAAISALYTPQATYRRDSTTTFTYVITALSLVIILTGALVRGSGASLACIDWPLCNGDLVPVQQGQLAMIHWFHRLSVLALGIGLLWLTVSIVRTRADGSMRKLVFVAGAMYLMQAGIGAMYVFTSASPLFGALHVLFAAVTWASLVVLSFIETINTGAHTALPENPMEKQWQAQSDLATN